MRLVVDVGNTETVLGLFSAESDRPVAHWRYATPVRRTPDELVLLVRSFLLSRDIDPAGISGAVVGSVVPAQTELLRLALGELTEDRVLVLDSADGLPIRLDVDAPRTVGADRIANTLAAARLYERDTVVVDLGTATTYDCITGDGVFLGGVIAPGLQAGQEWLGGRTAMLPRVELRRPERVIGRRTETCLESGIFYSAVDAVDGIVDRIRHEWERPSALVVATGGYAGVLAEHSRTVERVEPHLTLIGLELVGRHRDG